MFALHEQALFFGLQGFRLLAQHFVERCDAAEHEQLGAIAELSYNRIERAFGL